MMRRLALPAGAAGAWLCAPPAWACTLCHSDTAAEVREGVAAGGWQQAAALFAVLPALAAGVLLARRITP